MGIEYEKGHFQTFTANTTFHLGGVDVKVEAGTDFDYDGYTLRYDEKEVSCQKARLAIAQGWASLSGQDNTGYVPAKGLLDKYPVDGGDVVAVGKKMASPSQKKAAREAPQESVFQTRADGGSMDATTSATPKAPSEARAGKVESHGTKVAKATRGLENITANVSAPQHLTESSVTASVSSPQHLTESSVTASVTPSHSEISDEDSGTVVGTVSKSTDTAPTQTPPDGLIEAQVAMIQNFVPGFTWNFNAPIENRVQAALKYRDNLLVLSAILKIETSEVGGRIRQAVLT